MISATNYIESACEKAIKNVAQRMVEELESYIRADFYNQYKPRFYDRTYQLLKSPKYNLLNPKTAEVFINMDTIHYLIDDPKYDGSSEDIVNLAARGYHGSIDIFRPGMFWEDFVQWADKNIPHIFKTELKRQGIPVI